MMATATTKSGGRERAAAQKRKPEGLPFTRKNYYLFLVGLAVIVIGYIALAQGSITLAPILLVLGYCVLIPVAILYRGGGDDKPAATKPEP
jgi:Flp pilus assembly protein TadB